MAVSAVGGGFHRCLAEISEAEQDVLIGVSWKTNLCQEFKSMVIIIPITIAIVRAAFIAALCSFSRGCQRSNGENEQRD